ncbi:MAG: Crp/Fnr family transcriptional regulator [Thermoplasmata archaeon]
MNEEGTDPVVGEISRHPFLRGLSVGFLGAISRGARTRTYSVDEYLLREGDEADHLFLVLSGKVALEVIAPDHHPLTIESIGPGGVVGWSWSTGRRRYEHNARVLKTTQAIALEARVLRAACESDPAMGFQLVSRLLDVVADRLANTRLQLLNTQQV